MEALYNLAKMVTFNSTRYIRNYARGKWLGRDLEAFNSTRYIRNHIDKAQAQKGNPHLSTPHGTLGTAVDVCLALGEGQSFNSTRYIRNQSKG